MRGKTRQAKQQSAMEYLMTYGWAILIIAVVLGVLFQLGVFSSSSFAPRAPPGSCRVFRPGGPSTVSNINLVGVCSGQLPQYVAQFDGQSSYIDILYSSVFNPTSAITLSIWVKFNNLVADQGILSKDHIDYQAYHPGWGQGFFHMGVRFADSSDYDRAVAISTGRWYNFVITYNGTYGQFYSNGAQIDSTNIGSKALHSSTEDLWLGKNMWTGASYFNGSMANVQIYNTSLSANDVQSLYIEGIGGAPQNLQNLVAWWPLNGDANDYSGKNNNGAPTSLIYTSSWLNGYTPP